MRVCGVAFFLAWSALLGHPQGPDGPTDPKAAKTYQDALNYLKERRTDAALDDFKKANKQDGGHCGACLKKIIKCAFDLRDWKSAETAAQQVVADAQGENNIALAHYQFGLVLLNEALEKHKNDLFSHAHQELTDALTAVARFPDALFADGQALAHLQQDDQAKAQFQKFVDMKPAGDPIRQRALRFISQPELARARLAPAFAVTTLDGQRVSLDDFNGKVVLLDFWATWCGPCREALPHMRTIAKNFQGQPLVVLSVSLDSDEQKWKDFITKNEMTWLQYRDGGFNGPVSRLFDVGAIPHTFTIDADGVLQDEHIGDASIEGKLKKLLVHAKELQAPEKPGQ